MDVRGDLLLGDLQMERCGDLLLLPLLPCPWGVDLGVDFLFRPLLSRLLPSFLGVLRMLKAMVCRRLVCDCWPILALLSTVDILRVSGLSFGVIGRGKQLADLLDSGVSGP